MEAIAKYKSALFILGILVVAFFAYRYFFPATAGEPALGEEAIAGASPVENELVRLLLRLQSVDLPDGVFNNESFRSLEDFSQKIIDEPKGRENPFAPLPGSVQTTPKR